MCLRTSNHGDDFPEISICISYSHICHSYILGWHYLWRTEAKFHSKRDAETALVSAKHIRCPRKSLGKSHQNLCGESCIICKVLFQGVLWGWDKYSSVSKASIYPKTAAAAASEFFKLSCQWPKGIILF